MPDDALRERPRVARHEHPVALHVQSVVLFAVGQPKLSCQAFLRDYQDKTIKVEPLDGFPIERDLVVVIDSFMDRLASVKPYLIAKEERALLESLV